MVRKILLPLDGSPFAETVLAQARDLLRHEDAEVVLLCAVSMPPGAEVGALELPEILERHAAEYLQSIAAPLIEQGARVRTVTRTGDAASVILDVAAEEKVSLILMATHGRSGITRWALGSVAEKVVRASPVPVLTLRPSAAGLALEKILVPVDATERSLEVLPSVIDLAHLYGSHVILLHVCDGPQCSVPVPQITRAYEQLREAGVSVEPLMKVGDPAAEILLTAKGQGAGLIAMTTHARRGWSKWMLGSVTEKVLHAADVPLLIVRPAPKARGARAEARTSHAPLRML